MEVDAAAPSQRSRGGCLSLRNPVGRLAWLSFLSGAAFAATVWPGNLGGWWFHAAVFVWILTAVVWTFWIAVAVSMVRAIRKMQRMAGMRVIESRAVKEEEDEA